MAAPKNRDLPIPENTVVNGFRAEDEPWLEKIYVEPGEMESLAGDRGTIVFGPSGMGCTALRLNIVRKAQAEANGNLLIVHWLPEAPEDEIIVNTLARAASRQMVALWIETLLLELAAHPERLAQSPIYARQGLMFFIHKYLPFDPHFYIMSISSDLPESSQAAVEQLFTLPPVDVFRSEPPTQQLLTILTKLTNNLGYKQIWVMIDGLRRWPEGMKVSSRDMLAAMLDTLALFEVKGLVFKVFVTDEYRPIFSKLGGINRLRLMPYDLKFSDEELIEILNRHTARLLHRDPFNIRQVCGDPQWLNWLRQYAGRTPRLWLMLAWPFLLTWQAAGEDKPLSTDEWKRIAQVYPPPLRVIAAGQQVMLGEQVIPVTPSEYAILHYLYENRERICSREEIYYCALRGHPQVPVDPKLLEDPNLWNDPFDTAIWRLREKISPDAGRAYLLTVRGKGLCLKNTW